MYYLNKKNADGSPLELDAINLAEEISEYCFSRTIKTEIYTELKKNFQSDYLEIYFKKFYFIEVLPIAHHLILKEWDYKNNKSLSNKKINLAQFDSREYLKEFFNNRDIEYENKIDQEIIKQKLIKLIKISKNFFKKLIDFPIKKKIILNQSPKIAVGYNEGVNIDKRSDLFWFDSSIINPEDAFIYFEYRGQQKRYGSKSELLNKIKNLQIKPINLWEYSFDADVTFLSKLKEKIKNINVSNNDDFFLKKVSYELIDKFKYWYQFFKKFHVKIHIDSKDFNQDGIVKYLALSKLGGCTIDKLRSHVEEKRLNGSPPINSCDIFFTSNKDSIVRKKNYTINKFKYMIVSGFPYNSFTKNNMEELKKIEKFFHKHKKKFIILLLDSDHGNNKNNNFQTVQTEALYKFYVSLFEKFSKISSVGIILKNKKPRSLKNLKDMHSKILNYQKQGLCYLIEDPIQKMPFLYASISDLVVATCHCYPSGLLECVLLEKKGVFLDLVNLKNVEKEWYKWGENKVIFKDQDLMIEKIQNFIDGKQNKDFGNWQDHRELIDPYKDNLGSKRIGMYLNVMLECYKKGFTNIDAILKANNEFKKKWGSDKIFKC